MVVVVVVVVMTALHASLSLSNVPFFTSPAGLCQSALRSCRK
jgi:hypothetical protein